MKMIFHHSGSSGYTHIHLSPIFSSGSLIMYQNLHYSNSWLKMVMSTLFLLV
uniref:Uncharacterized protein n=1 Tax=Arundo donax TaxID=35708 RepID=A0A0A9D169_ARUDO